VVHIKTVVEIATLRYPHFVKTNHWISQSVETHL